MSLPFFLSSLIFAATFFFIVTERMHRTVIALVGAMLMVVVGDFFHFYEPQEAILAVDFNTIGLLFGMMVLVVLLERTGFFQYLGILTAKKTKGNPWLLLVALGGLTSALSTILDNVTTIILIAPVTIIIARILSLNPTPYLLAEAMLSNVGGAGTLVGDPPNIMIGSAAGYTFNTFLIHALPVAALAWAATLVFFFFFFRKEWQKKPMGIERLLQMNEREAITDPATLKKALLVLAGVVTLFFLHGALHLEASVVALLGAAAALLLIQAHDDPQPVLEKVELSVLLFFTALFVLVGGLEHAGVLEWAAQFILSGAEANILLTAIIILWASAILSAIVDNIPLTVAMIPIILTLAEKGVPVDLLWWALVFGVGFGGNASPIGSTAGVIAVSKSEQTDQPISFLSWIKTGVPATAVALLIATGALLAFHFFEVTPTHASQSETPTLPSEQSRY
ncbi:MAG: membrane protein [Candidatus Parcubacteria bacterium]|nr:MAG: membrane protein [Candidatus Parcubacteria bacterium]